MPAPATILEPIVADLASWSLSEFQLHKVIRILRDAFEHASKIDERCSIANNIGQAFFQLGDFNEALRQYHIARQMRPDEWIYANNCAAALHRVGSVEDAVEEIVKACEIPGGRNALVLANLSIFLSELGQVDDARSALREAVQVSAQGSANQLCALAIAAANIGHDREAAEFLARAAHARFKVPLAGRTAPAVLQDAPAAFWGPMADQPLVRAAVMRVANAEGDFAELARNLSAEPRHSAPDADDALGVLADTQGWRSRATQAELSGDPDER